MVCNGSTPPKKKPLTRWAIGSLSCCFSEFIVLPLDLSKIRLQLHRELNVGAPAAKNSNGSLLSTARAIFRSEGPLAFWAGSVPAMARQILYGGVSYAMYAPLRDTIAQVRSNSTRSGKDATVLERLFSGAFAGAFGGGLATPCDIIKVRMQADGRLGRNATRYNSFYRAILSIWRQEGLAGLYKGITPIMGRAATVNAVSFTCYDTVKQTTRRILGEKYSDSILGRFISAMMAGVATSLASSPFDVVKTRFINQNNLIKQPMYRSPLDCLFKSVRADGLVVLLRGFFPAWYRLGPFELITYQVYETLSQKYLNETI